uniref:Uncharacterized protein n=1 Tax=Opuntia streptacantha TaxID=393608 RepID=A0A7C9D4F8_OPUST
MSNADLSRLQTIDHIMQNRTNIEQHIAYPSDIMKARNAAFLARIACPEPSSSPPGNVNPAVKVIVAKSAATSDIMSRICVKSARGLTYIVREVGSTSIISHICFQFSSCLHVASSKSIAVFLFLSLIVRSTSSILSNISASSMFFLLIATCSGVSPSEFCIFFISLINS